MDIRGISLALIVALAALLVAGQIARRRLAHRYRPAGRFIHVGGRRIHVQTFGTRADGPTIVLEAGLGVPGVTWSNLAARLATHAPVLTYDRAGLGWSDERQGDHGADVLADELHDLLRTVGLPQPYLLVGHSLGGEIVRVFAARHPGLVAGMVLLDGSHEEQFERSPMEIRTFLTTMARRMAPIYRVLELLARLGILALRPALVPNSLGAVPAEILATIRAQVASRPEVIRAMAREMNDVMAAHARIRALAITTFGDIPLAVVAHGRAEGSPPQLGPDIAVAYEAVWQSLQAAQAALSPRGRVIVADGVGHNIPLEAPELSERVILEVLDEARTLRREPATEPFDDGDVRRVDPNAIGRSAGMPAATSAVAARSGAAS